MLLNQNKLVKLIPLIEHKLMEFQKQCTCWRIMLYVHEKTFNISVSFLPFNAFDVNKKKLIKKF